MQKGSAQLLLLLLFLILIAGGIFFYRGRGGQTATLILPTAQINTEKTYSNLLGFQFNYPGNLTAKEDSEEEFDLRGNGDFRKNFKGYVAYEPGKFLGGVVVLGKDGSYEQNPFTLWIFDNPNDLTIDAWYKMYWYYPFVWGDFTYTGKFSLAPNTEATISGQMAKSGIIDYQPGKPKFIYLRSKELVHLSKGKSMYLFRIIGESGDKILSTFKFLN